MSDPDPAPGIYPGGWTQSQPPQPSSNVRQTMDQMTEQLQTVIDAAERAAEAIRLDAEEQAHHHLTAAQREADRLTAERVGLISDLTDDLIHHAGTVRKHSEDMVRALEEAIGSVTAKLDQPALSRSFSSQASRSDQANNPSPATAPAQRDVSHAIPASARATGASPADTTSVERPPQPIPVAEDALLLATRLAVAGNDRATIAAALRHDLGLANPGPVVARVFGER